MFGATLLNRGVHHTALSRRAMEAINRRGQFNNLDDLDTALARTYEDHKSLRRVGRVTSLSESMAVVRSAQPTSARSQ